MYQNEPGYRSATTTRNGGRSLIVFQLLMYMWRYVSVQLNCSYSGGKQRVIHKRKSSNNFLTVRRATRDPGPFSIFIMIFLLVSIDLAPWNFVNVLKLRFSSNYKKIWENSENGENSISRQSIKSRGRATKGPGYLSLLHGTGISFWNSKYVVLLHMY